MLRLFDTLGKKTEKFRPAKDRIVTIFTCGPSIYRRAHIGNFRTFLFEDILIRYLEYLGYAVKRGMNFTDIEDKAIEEARKRKVTVRQLTDENIRKFLEEIDLLKMKIPDHLPRSSKTVDAAVAIIGRLLDLGVAYRYGKNIYFDPLKFPDFGRLYGLDMRDWPRKKRRFHKDTYPGMRWNRGDFILWHGCSEGDTICWDSEIGRGRPAWSIQDPSMISTHFNETLSIYCGGIDNLFRHHDYTRAILESIRPYPMARYWLHCHHLYAKGKKMSKSKGNVCYTDTLLEHGYSPSEIRFFLIYGHYRKRLNYSNHNMQSTVEKLRAFKRIVRSIEKRADDPTKTRGEISNNIEKTFRVSMDNDLDVKGAFDEMYRLLSSFDVRDLSPGESAAITGVLKAVDEVFKVMF